ncbi:Facilitated trehalose transporter Tret1like, partial [Caligus rogercresseyi]
LYIVEISSLSNRDLNASFPSVSVNIGIVLIYIADTILNSWNLVAGFGAILTGGAMLLIIICMVPESPFWLIQTGNRDGAVKSLNKLLEPEDIEQGRRAFAILSNR